MPLTKADAFLWELDQMHQFKLRCECWMFRASFGEDIVSVKDRLQAVVAATTALRESNCVEIVKDLASGLKAVVPDCCLDLEPRPCVWQLYERWHQARASRRLCSHRAGQAQRRQNTGTQGLTLDFVSHLPLLGRIGQCFQPSSVSHRAAGNHAWP